MKMSSEVEGEDIFSLPLLCPHPCPSGPLRPEIDCQSFFGVFGNCLRPSSPTFDPMSPSNALRPCLNRAGEEALPSLFGNHPISSGFLRRISSRTIMAIPTTEKDRDKPPSHFRHIYASVCTSYAVACGPYALFRLEQKARRE